MRKHVGELDDAPDDYLSPDDFDEAVWWVEKHGERGFEFVAEMDGRPFEVDIRDVHGSGTFRVTPVGMDGKPVKKLQDVLKIAKPPSLERAANQHDGEPGAGTDMPPMMAYMLKQQQEQAERAERLAQQREEKRLEREERDNARRESMEERKERKDWERQEREERLTREKQERDDKRAEERTQMMQTLMTGGMAIAQAVVTASMNKQPTDTNDRLLEALLLDRNQRSDQSNSMRDSLELLVVLDKMADNRTVQHAPPPEKEPDIMQSMMQMLPAFAMMKAGGGAQAQVPPGLPSPIVENPVAQIAQAVQNPDVMAQVINHDPDAVAQAIKAAMASDPALESKLIAAFTGDEE
tara:strand:- start:2617 stop:3672 length:1056 start_codon:yes stop_codon:yes gene_type:complete